MNKHDSYFQGFIFIRKVENSAIFLYYHKEIFSFAQLKCGIWFKKSSF